MLAYPNLWAAVPYGLEAQFIYNGVTLNANKGGASSGAFSNYAFIVEDCSSRTTCRAARSRSRA